ncbi:unnamed protein product [Ambrosiozyma monospora]|uniref:Unnamed protein product n=1 Tax=Ambrosiozyma monospora TaxID=43982 RepID=A0A9W7DGK2_AMBMO|nr:unnamed protein product [Ambrosiozyma monospora]
MSSSFSGNSINQRKRTIDSVVKKDDDDNDNDNDQQQRNTRTKLLPKIVLPYAPVRQDERQHYLSLLHKQYVNAQVAEPTLESIEKEYEICKRVKNRMAYMNDIKRLMYNVMKSAKEKKKLSTIQKDNNNTNTNTNTSPVSNENQNKKDQKKSKVGITPDTNCEGRKNKIIIDKKTQEMSSIGKLKSLCVPKERLIQNGFVMEVPEKIDSIKDFVECNHCGLPFSRACEYPVKSLTDIVHETSIPGLSLSNAEDDTDGISNNSGNDSNSQNPQNPQNPQNQHKDSYSQQDQQDKPVHLPSRFKTSCKFHPGKKMTKTNSNLKMYRREIILPRVQTFNTSRVTPHEAIQKNITDTKGEN